MRAWMRPGIGAVTIAAIGMLVPVPRAGAAVSIEDGFEVTSDDGRTSLGLGGRIQQDWAFIQETSDLPDTLRSPDGTELRRARLHVEGDLYGTVFFKSQWELAGGSVEPLDVYMGVRDVPGLQNVRVGKQYEPFGLNELTSSNHLVFAERAVTAKLAPSRKPGIQTYGRYAGGRGTWAVGLFRDDSAEDDTGKSTGDGEYAETARVTALPVSSENGRTLVHLGVAASHRVPPGHVTGYSFGPEAHLAASLIAVEDLPVNGVLLVGAEAAVVAGPLSVQGEWTLADHDGRGDAPSPAFQSFYGFASVFLTGEHRTYKTSSATFGRVKPRRNLGDGQGAFGALEVAARVSRVDLDDPAEDVAGGALTNVTVGMNWYLNPNAKVVVNLVRAAADDVDGAVYALVTRFHVDF